MFIIIIINSSRSSSSSMLYTIMLLAIIIISGAGEPRARVRLPVEGGREPPGAPVSCYRYIITYNYNIYNILYIER